MPGLPPGGLVHCATWRGTKLIPGAMADYFLVPAPNLAADTLRLPDTVSDAAATLIEPLACSVKAMRRAGVGPGTQRGGDQPGLHGPAEHGAGPAPGRRPGDRRRPRAGALRAGRGAGRAAAW